MAQVGAPGRRPQLSDEVATRLRERIMSGRLRPGEFVRLDQVADELGVSVTPVREALLALRGEDMVTLEPRRGYVVTSISRQDIDDMFGLAAELAGELGRRAAQRISTEEFADLVGVNTELTAAIRQTRIEDVQRLEYDFHRAINRAARSRKLAWFLTTASRYLPQTFYTSDPAWRANTLRDHDAILTGLRLKDEDATRSALVRHVNDGAERLVKHLYRIGLWSEPD